MSRPETELLPWTRVFTAMMLLDLGAVLSGLSVAYALRYGSLAHLPLNESAGKLPVFYLLPMAAVWLTVFRMSGLYARENLVSGIGEYRRIASAGLSTTVAIIVAAYFVSNPPVSRGLLLIAMMSVGVLVASERFWIRRYIYASATRGHPMDRILIVGSGPHAAAVAQQLTQSPSASSEVAGFLSEYLPVGSCVAKDKRVLGEPLQLEAVAAKLGATRAVVVEAGLSWESLQGMVRLMHRPGSIEICIVPGLFDLHATAMSAHQLGPVLTLAPQPARIMGMDAVLKRSFDITVGALGLVISLPLIISLALSSALNSGSVGLERELFVGPRGPFSMVQFAGPGWARRRHVSRLPNLLLVLTGKMSLLGPRPVRAQTSGGYIDSLQYLSRAKPGFIGPWWLVGVERPSDLSQELIYDLYYLRNYSIWLDLHIALQAVRRLLGGQPRLEWLSRGLANAIVPSSDSS